MARTAGGKSSLIVALLLLAAGAVPASAAAAAEERDEPEVATFEVALLGDQGQAYRVEPDYSYHCLRYGSGMQLVEFLTDHVRVEIAETPRGYTFLRRGRPVNSVVLPIDYANVTRIDFTQRTDDVCDYNYEASPPTPVPLPPKDCSTNIETDVEEITDKMDSLDLFLTGRRPQLSGGYFWLYERGGDVIYGDPYANCLAFGYDGRAGDGLFEGVRLPSLPDDLLDHRGWQRFRAKGKGTFTRNQEPTGVGQYMYEGETYDDYRVGSDVNTEERLRLFYGFKRIGEPRPADR